MDYNPAERVIFNQIHFPDTSGIMSGSGRTKVHTADMAIVSRIVNTWDFKTNLLCEVGALGNNRPKGMVPAWAVAWLKDSGMAVDMKPEHPHTLTCVGKATARALAW